LGTSLPPPTTVISRLLSDQVLDIFQKKSCGGHHKTSKSSLDDFHRKNAVDIIELLFEHESITIEIVPQLKKIQKKPKKFNRMRWTSLDYFVNTNRLQLKLFLNSKKFKKSQKNSKECGGHQ